MTQAIENLTQAEIISIISRNLNALIEASEMGTRFICNTEESGYNGKILVEFDYEDVSVDNEEGKIYRSKGKGVAQIGSLTDLDTSRIYGRRDFTDWHFEAEIQDEDTGIWVCFTGEQFQQEDDYEAEAA